MGAKKDQLESLKNITGAIDGQKLYEVLLTFLPPEMLEDAPPPKPKRTVTKKETKEEPPTT